MGGCLSACGAPFVSCYRKFQSSIYKPRAKAQDPNLLARKPKKKSWIESALVYVGAHSSVVTFLIVMTLLQTVVQIAFGIYYGISAFHIRFESTGIVDIFYLVFTTVIAAGQLLPYFVVAPYFACYDHRVTWNRRILRTYNICLVIFWSLIFCIMLISLITHGLVRNLSIGSEALRFYRETSLLIVPLAAILALLSTLTIYVYGEHEPRIKRVHTRKDGRLQVNQDDDVGSSRVHYQNRANPLRKRTTHQVPDELSQGSMSEDVDSSLVSLMFTEQPFNPALLNN